MTSEEVKIALILCNCGKSLLTLLDYNKITNHFKKSDLITDVYDYADLCFDEKLNELIELMKRKTHNAYVIAACTPQVIELAIQNKLKEKNLEINFEIVNIREQCAWVHNDIEKATEKTILLIQAAIAKMEEAIPIILKRESLRKHVTVIGGGISGLQVASDLCALGFEVQIIEKKAWLGGHVTQLEKVAPLNERGQEVVGRVLETLTGKNIQFKLNSEIQWIDGSLGDFKVKIRRKPNYINYKCDSCKKCNEICPVLITNRFEEGLSKRKAIDPLSELPFGQSFLLDRESCLPNCTKCEEICPRQAINLAQEEIEETIETSFIIFSTGYELYRPKDRSVFNSGRSSDVLNQLQLARMLDPVGPTQGKVIQPSSGQTPKRILMVQCVGSRDVEHAEYCSKYCCTTAIRHAIEIRKQVPDCEIGISYIDIRTPFMDEELYREARELGIDFIRGKIGNIYYETNSFITEVIDTLLVRQINFESDIIVLSTAMLPSRIPSQITEIAALNMRNDGFIQEYYPKLKLTDTNRVGIYTCGTASGPKLVSECIADAHAVAVSIVKDYPDEMLIRESAISIINEELCNGCELCVRLCPFEIPKMIEVDGENIAKIDPKQCKGCGTCVSLCPTNAVQLEALHRDQLFAQIKAILADASHHKNPIIIGFVCEECAYATIDFAGMLKKSYSTNTRFIRLPCVGRLSALDILTTLENGADMVLLFGCEDAKCHYLEGNSRANILVKIMKDLLQAIGWDAERIKMHGLFSADVHKFIEAIETADKLAKELGPSAARLKLMK